MIQRRSFLSLVIAGFVIVGSVNSASAQKRLSGKVKIDGSSTVAPITMATAELFQGTQPRVRVTVGVSGTGGGFKKFLDERPDLRTHINDASRTIKQSEIQKAKKLGVEYIELPIAIDGIAVMVNNGNKFCNHLTVEELKRIWAPGSKINNWKQVRPGFPDVPLKLYGPGPDSGTFDYFTKAVVGKEKACRSDFTASENDNVLVQGIAGDRGSLGYFGFSYYEANKNKLKLLGVAEAGGKPVVPTLDVIRGGTYKPLSRPLFLYINKSAADLPEVKAFMSFFFKNAKKIVEHPRVNYVALSDDLYKLAKARLDKKTTGSLFADGSADGKELMDVYRGR